MTATTNDTYTNKRITIGSLNLFSNGRLLRQVKKLIYACSPVEKVHGCKSNDKREAQGETPGRSSLGSGSDYPVVVVVLYFSLNSEPFSIIIY